MAVIRLGETNPLASERPVSSEEEGRPDPILRCDLCGAEAMNVRRIALDGKYDRLRKPHQVLYACAPCSEKKERQRLGLERSPGRG